MSGGILGRSWRGRRGQEEGMWPWVSRQAGFSGKALDQSLGVAAPDYQKWVTQNITLSPQCWVLPHSHKPE